MAKNTKSASWWQTLPGILTATAALITAATGAIVALRQIGPPRDPEVVTIPSGDPSGGSGDPSKTARAFLDAWDRGDRAGALKIAEPAVVEKSFGLRRPVLDAREATCYVSGTGQRDCHFSHANGALLVRLRESERGWRVVQVEY